MDTINLLSSIDDDYVSQFTVTLYPIYQNSSSHNLAACTLQKQLLKKNDDISEFCQKLGVRYTPVVIGEEAFENAPTTNRYPETIYYRLLAHEYLPKELDKILCVGAGILYLNDVVPLYKLDLEGKLYTAVNHTSDGNISELVSKLRLRNFEAEGYLNSGVLLMNLDAIRQSVHQRDILDYIEQNNHLLLLPDQNILNASYRHQTLQIPDQIYNYDTRYNVLYYGRSSGKWNLSQVIEHMVFLHFCRRDKPQKKDYHGRYSALYKHYQHRVLRLKNKKNH